jgi:hypothetical protein
MTEIKADLYDEQILNRKKYAEKLFLSRKENSLGGVARRQNIFLTEHADGLSDNELISHKREMLRRKFLSYVSFFLIPGALYYNKYSTRTLVVSLLPSIYLAEYIYTAQFLNTNCSYSFSLSQNSQSRFLEKIALFNNRRLSTADDLFQPPKNALHIKDWIARNEYR